MAVWSRRVVLLGLLIVLLCAAQGLAVEIPKIDRAVVDLAEVFSADEVEELSATLHELHQETGMQMAVLTVGTTGELPIEAFGLAVAEAWGGGRAGDDDGLLLIFAIDDRASRLEVGYGLEAHIPDFVARKWLDGVAPRMRDGDYGLAASDMIRVVRNQYDYRNSLDRNWRDEDDEDERDDPLGTNPWSVVFMFYFGVGAGVWWKRQRKVAGDSADNEKIATRLPSVATLVIWFAAPALIALAFHEGEGFLFVMPILWFTMAWFGVILESFGPATKYKYFGLRTGAFMCFQVLVWVLLLAVSLSSRGRFKDVEDMGPVFVIAGLIVMVAYVAAEGVNNAELGLSGSGTSTYRSSSYRSRTSSSSSSSSSSSRGSSSSNSRSYGGRGGSFGGGGASSRW